VTAAPPHILIALNRLGSGGVERVTLHLANGFARRGNRVTLALVSPGGPLEHRLDPEVRVVSIGNGRAVERGLGLLRAVRPLAKLVGVLRPDVLLSPGNHTSVLVTLAHGWARAGDVGLALKLTNPVERAGAGHIHNRVRRRLFRSAAGAADVLLTLSEAARSEAAKIAPSGAAKLKTVVNPYIDDALLSRPPGSRPPDDAAPMLLSVGRLTEQKDPLMMLDAVGGLADRQWRLVMIGEGPLQQACIDRAAALGIADRVQFAGFIADPQPYFEQARLFLLSSRYEELPAVLFEAAAAGVPIVATAASASIEQLFTQMDGVRIVPPGDVQPFRSAVAEALDRPPPPPIARESLEKFSISNGIASHAAALGLR
jgi:glycosyltransferase involved in cell wall biosynthesis